MKLLVVGEAPTKEAGQPLSLETRSGLTFYELGGGPFDKRNLFDRPVNGSWPRQEAAERAASVLAGHEGPLLLLGRRVAEAFGWSGDFLRWGQLADDGRAVMTFPHPSGLSHWWNEPTNRQAAREALSDLRERQFRLPEDRFGALVVDPPWPYREVDGPRAGGYSIEQYTSMSLADLSALPLGCASYVFLWTTLPFVEEAHDLLRAWGYEPKTALPWVKVESVREVPDPFPSAGKQVEFKPYYGVGYWFRGAVELIVVGKKPKARSIRTHWAGILSPNARHSRKPETLQDLVELTFPRPYLEVFGRRTRNGWTVLGNEIDGMDVRDSLRRI